MKVIKNLSQVETALQRIAELEVGIAQEDNKAQEVINKAKAAAQEASGALIAERDEIIARIKEYSDAHRQEVYAAGKKSRDFTNGSIGYWRSPDSIEVSKDTAELLEKAGFMHCIKVKKEPVKAALKGFSDEQLLQFGASRIAGEESFFVKASQLCVQTGKGAA